jgi:hypothetical protein
MRNSGLTSILGRCIDADNELTRLSAQEKINSLLMFMKAQLVF